MKQMLYNFRCDSCGSRFKAPEITEVYGGFIMRSNHINDSVYLNSLDDKVFDEMETLFKSNEIVKNNGRLNDTDLFQSLFSISCDLASDGSQYQIGLFPICPNCGSRNMASWGRTHPLELTEEDMEPVKHENWNKLTDMEKRNLFNEAIKTYLNKD